MFQEALTDEGKEIFPYLKNFNEEFYLAGGTALALQMGHRISVDFDFFSEKEIPKNLLSKVEKIFSGKKIAIEINNPEELTAVVDGVKITFVKYPFIFPDNLIEFGGIKVLNIKNIAAAKAYSIGRRGVLKDYVDLYYVISEKCASLEEIIGLSEKIFSDAFNSRLFLEQLIYLEDIEDAEIMFLKESVEKNMIKSFFEEEIKKLKLDNFKNIS